MSSLKVETLKMVQRSAKAVTHVLDVASSVKDSSMGKFDLLRLKLRCLKTTISVVRAKR